MLTSRLLGALGAIKMVPLESCLAAFSWGRSFLAPKKFKDSKVTWGVR